MTGQDGDREKRWLKRIDLVELEGLIVTLAFALVLLFLFAMGYLL